MTATEKDGCGSAAENEDEEYPEPPLRPRVLLEGRHRGLDVVDVGIEKFDVAFVGGDILH